VSDVVVTVPKRLWSAWIDEGDLPGEEESGCEYAFYLGGPRPEIHAGERVYVVAHGKVRGYAPLVRFEYGIGTRYALIRSGSAVACTIPDPVTGFRGWRYRWWNRVDEVPFPDWQHAQAAAADASWKDSDK
jgi:hypothetical protein